MADFDFIVAGAGLAGACAARRLAEHGSVAVVERREPASGGSGAAAGLVNAILGLRARPVWRIEEALAALDETVALADAASCYRRGPTLRPARDREQVERFRQAADEYPQHCTWLDDPDFPWLRAPHGALRIETGGVVDLDGLIDKLLSGIEVYRMRLVGWTESRTAAAARLTRSSGDGAPEVLRARYLILALGRGYTAFPQLMRLRLHQVKGQTIRMTRPSALPAGAPHLAGTGYAASDGGNLVCGSTYEHRFADLQPSHRATQSILKKVEQMLPSIRDAELLEERTGVRVTVPGIRLPMVGPLPGSRRVWIFTGLGAKGLLTGPLVAKELPGYLEDAGRIPGEIRVRPAE